VAAFERLVLLASSPYGAVRASDDAGVANRARRDLLTTRYKSVCASMGVSVAEVRGIAKRFKKHDHKLTGWIHLDRAKAILHELQFSEENIATAVRALRGTWMGHVSFLSFVRLWGLISASD
jgi:hypothetical protein